MGEAKHKPNGSHMGIDPNKCWELFFDMW